MSDIPDTFENAFQGKQFDIAKKLNPRSGLLQLLEDHQLIDFQQHQSLSLPIFTEYKCSNELLNMLKKADDRKVGIFFQDLVKCNQPHIVEMILGRDLELHEFGWKSSPDELDKTIETVRNLVTARDPVSGPFHVHHPQGLALCDGKLYVVCHESDTVIVFGPNNERLAPLKVTGMSHPGDIVAYKDKDMQAQLFIMDSKDGYGVWRVTINSSGEMSGCTNLFANYTAEWPFYANSVSLSSNKLLVSTFNKSKSPFMQLLLFKIDAADIQNNFKTFLFPAIGEFNWAVLTTRETFILIGNKTRPHLREVDMQGIMLRSCTETFGNPCHMVPFSEGRFVIADHGRGCVYRVDSEFRVVRTLQRFLSVPPSRLCYDEKSFKLGISGWDGEDDEYVKNVKLVDI